MKAFTSIPVGATGNQGAVVAEIHGTGVSTPVAAAVSLGLPNHQAAFTATSKSVALVEEVSSSRPMAWPAKRQLDPPVKRTVMLFDKNNAVSPRPSPILRDPVVDLDRLFDQRVLIRAFHDLTVSTRSPVSTPLQ